MIWLTFCEPLFVIGMAIGLPTLILWLVWGRNPVMDADE